MKRTIYILTGDIAVLAIGLTAILIFMKNQPSQTRGIEPMVVIAPMEPDSSKWGVNFPNQYSTLLKTEDNNRTTFGGLNRIQNWSRIRVWLPCLPVTALARIITRIAVT
jgi:hypothetical protein